MLCPDYQKLQQTMEELEQAKEEAKHFSKIIADLTKNDLEYPVEQIEE